MKQIRVKKTEAVAVGPLSVLLLASLLFGIVAPAQCADSIYVFVQLQGTVTPPVVIDSLRFGIGSVDSIGQEFGILNLKSLAVDPPGTSGDYPRFSRMYSALFCTDHVDSLITAYSLDGHIYFAFADTARIVLHTGPTEEPFYPNQWALNNTGDPIKQHPDADGTTDVDAPEAWEFTGGTADIVVAVIDGGTRITHSEFNGQLWVNTGESLNGIDDDDNNVIDDVNGANFTTSPRYTGDPDNNDPVTGDPTGADHGTACSGIVSAALNGEGTIGIAYGCKLMAIKTFIPIPEGFGGVSPPPATRFAESIRYADRMGADVLSLSLGSENILDNVPALEVLQDIAERELSPEGRAPVVCIATGNYLSDLRNELAFTISSSKPGGVPLEFPDVPLIRIPTGNACYTGERVGSSRYAFATDLSRQQVSVIAPGGGTDKDGYCYQEATNNRFLWDNYTRLSDPYDPTFRTGWYTPFFGGTSAAAPTVAAIAALVRSDDPNLQARVVKQIIEESAVDVLTDPAAPNEQFPGWDQYTGYGVANAQRALLYPMISEPEPDAIFEGRDVVSITWRTPKTHTNRVHSAIYLSIDGGVTYPDTLAVDLGGEVFPLSSPAVFPWEVSNDINTTQAYIKVTSWNPPYTGDPRDSVSAVVGPFTIKTRDWEVPGDNAEIAGMLSSTDVQDGDRILVGNPTDPPYSGFDVTKAVEILAEEGVRPPVDGEGRAYGVDIQDAGARVVGLEIYGGSTAAVRIAHQDGAGGTLEDCVIEISGSGPPLGIFQESGTVTGCTVNVESGTGIEMYGPGSSTVSNSIVTVTGEQATNYGIIQEAGFQESQVIETCTVSVPGGTGIYSLSPSGVIRGCTVRDAEIGIKSSSGGLVENSIAAEITGTAIWTSSSNKALNCIGHGIEGGVGFAPNSKGLGSVEEDPLFCDMGGDNILTLRIDSWGNPLINLHGLIGAHPVACAYGTLVRDTQFDGVADVPSDLIIPTGLNLDLLAGAILKFDAVDETNQGNSGVDVELTVNGTLTAVGVEGNSVRFISSAPTSPNGGDWFGILAQHASSTNPLILEEVELKNSIYGAWVFTSGEGSPSLIVTESFFEKNQVTDLRVGGYGYIEVNQNTFYTKVGYGIQLDNYGGGGTITGNYFLGSMGFPQAGINFQGTSYSSPYVVTDNAFVEFGEGYGIWVRAMPGFELSDVPVLTRNSFVDSHIGVYITKGSATVGGSTIEDGNEFDNVGYGINAACVVPGSCGGCIGPPVRVRHNRFLDYQVSGVIATKTASVDLGTSVTTDPGNNSFLDFQRACILGNAPTCGTIQAVGNYFGYCPDPECNVESCTWCTGGTAVNALPVLCEDPNLGPSSGEVTITKGGIWEQPGMRILGSSSWSPSDGLVMFELKGKPAQVRVEIFDLAGRRVRDLGELQFEPGVHQIPWDGTNRFGQRLPSGIHFIRLSASTGLKATAKLLTLRGGR